MLTRAALGGGRFLGVSALGDLAAELLHGLAVEPEGRALCYAYHGDLDMIGHQHGPGSLPWRMQLKIVDRLVAAIAECLRPGEVLLVVADHGMVVTDGAGTWTSTPPPRCSPGCAGWPARSASGTSTPHRVRPPTSWTRGAASSGTGAWVLARDEVIDAGWFGPTVSDVARGRIGEVVAAARGQWTLVRSRIEPHETALVGHHGSLTSAEQLVPLLVARG